MKRGAAWEARLDAWHREYRRDGLAWVARCHPPVRVLSPVRSGRFSACWAGDGPPDYVGVLAGGRAVVLDAKDCSRSRWPLADLQPHQARDLEAAHLRGAVSGIALRLDGAMWHLWWLPWGRLGPLYWQWHDGEAGRGGASLGAVQVAEIGEPIDDERGWLDAAGGMT